MKLKILGKRWTIERADPVMMTGCGVTGLTVYADQRMLVADGQSEDNARETALHEVLHAIAEGMGLRVTTLTYEQEEAAVNAFAKGLRALIADNPRATVDRLLFGDI